VSITAADTKLIRRQMADKRASDVIRLMTDFSVSDDQQLRNVATAVDLMKLVKRAKPTPLTAKARRYFEDPEFIAGFFVTTCETERDPEAEFLDEVPEMMTFIIYVYVVHLHVDTGNDETENEKRFHREFQRICASAAERPPLAAREHEENEESRRECAALVRRYFTPRPAWWVQEIDDLLDGKESEDAAYSRVPNGPKDTEEGWTRYDATCAQAVIDNPDFPQVMEAHRIRHAEAYARDPTGFLMTPEELRENDRLNAEARQALAERNAERQRVLQKTEENCGEASNV
jgi:hypothetical protein